MVRRADLHIKGTLHATYSLRWRKGPLVTLQAVPMEGQPAQRGRDALPKPKQTTNRMLLVQYVSRKVHVTSTLSVSTF